MAKTTFRIEGLSKLQAKLRELDKEVRGQAVKDATAAGAVLVVETTARLAPRAPKPTHPSFGHLADNIVAENPRKTASGATLRLGARSGFYWAAFLELGTSKMRAHPFMRPAIDFERENVVREQKKSLEESIRKAATVNG